MIFHTQGLKRLAVSVIVFCALITLVLWNKRSKHIAKNGVDLSLLHPKTSKIVDERSVYDDSSTWNMKNDNDIVVAIDNKTGHSWTLGHVRQDPMSESWLLENQTMSLDNNSSFSFPSLFVEPHEEHIQPSAKNRTSRHGKLLIFNRVPKCASEMFVDLFGKLMMKRNNHYNYYSWKSYWERQLTVEKEKEFLEWIRVKKNDQYQSPFAMDRHVYFIDATTYNLDPDLIPSWVNVVRDPIDRFVSLFNFLRGEHRWKNQKQKPPKEWFEKDINECVLSGDPECQFNPDSNYLKEHQLTYFCGSSLECKRVGSRVALQKAKYNAEKYYSVIGLQENVETSLCVMEAYLPLFFNRALGIYKTMGMEQSIRKQNSNSDVMKKLKSNSSQDQPLAATKSIAFTKNETPHKQKISELARNVLFNNLTLEYEFYDFVKRRLMLQAQHLFDKLDNSDSVYSICN